MSRARLYIEPLQIDKEIILKDKCHLHKLKDVLRLKEKQCLYVFDGEGKEWEYKINKKSRNEIILTRLRKSRESKKEKTILSLGFPLTQEKKIDFILQKATELGVSALTPFACARSLKINTGKSKIKRWKKIVIEACRQSERLWIPKIHSPSSLDKLIREYFDLKILAWPGKIEKIEIPAKKHGQTQQSILSVVGPEGGFSVKELEAFKKNDFIFTSLSLNTLRTETAAIFITGLIKKNIDEKEIC